LALRGDGGADVARGLKCDGRRARPDTLRLKSPAITQPPQVCFDGLLEEE